MPVEVISLLSSSDAGSPPRQTAETPPLPPADLATGTPPGSHRRRGSSVSPSRDRIRGASGPNGKPGSPTTTDRVWLLSDDECSPAASVARPTQTSNDGPVPKKRRLDSVERVERGNASSSRGAAPPAPLQPAVPGRLNCTARPLGQTTPPRPNSERTKSRTGLLDDDDLLTSSPPQENARTRLGTSTTRPRRPLDYLDDVSLPSSSSREEASPARTRTGSGVVDDDIDMFVSSSPGTASRPPQALPPTAVAWDPISSSAPLSMAAGDERPSPPRAIRRTQSEVIILDDSDGDSVAQSSSDDEFPDISSLAPSRSRFTSLPSLSELPALETARSKPSSKKPRSTGTKADPAEPKKSALERAREREEKAAAREAEKERKRLEKERAREEKAREKARAAALAEVNKLRTDKKVSTPEMIVDLPSTLDETVKLQVETLLRDLGVESTTWTSPVENVVKWRRKVRSRYNDELGLWEPVPERIDRENYAMVIVPATRFVDLVLGEDGASLESHVLRMRRHFPNDTVIYLIEGLAAWLRKNRNIRNQQFVSAVRSGLAPEEPPAGAASSSSSSTQGSSSTNNTNPRRRRTAAAAAQTYIDEDAVEDALLSLQVRHGALIHHTAAPVETARWACVFTQHISTAPYRRQRDAAHDASGAAFCMESGQVRTGDGPRDTYVRALQEVARLTAPVAHGLAAAFPSLPRLVRALEERGPLALERVPRCVSSDGAVSADRTVGQALSRRLYKIFTGRDETSTDI